MTTFLVSLMIFILALVAFSGLFAMFAGAQASKGGGGLVVSGILMFLFAAVAATVLFGWWMRQ